MVGIAALDKCAGAGGSGTGYSAGSCSDGRQQAPAQTAQPKPIPMGNINLENASLTAVIDQLARQLKLNLIVDPSVKGASR